MRREIYYIVFVFAVMFSLSFVSAEILLSQPNSVYNLGDTLSVSAEVTDADLAPLKLDLFCVSSIEQTKPNNRNETGESFVYSKSTSSVNLLNSPIKKVNISIPLTAGYFQNLDFSQGDFSGLNGDCKIIARFLSLSSETQSFRISKKIDVSLDIENMSVEPGKSIVIRGRASKENGASVNGFVDLFIEETNVSITRVVENGSFEFDFLFPENTKSGDYSLVARVYEKADSQITNTGEKSALLNVKQIPKKIKINMESQNIIPGDPIKFTVIITDQVGDIIYDKVLIEIVDEKNEHFSNQNFVSGEASELTIPSNSTSGYWRMKASAFGLTDESIFFVELSEKANFLIEEDILKVINVGNTVYRKPVEITIGEFKETKNVELGVGESISFKIFAPDGNYSISVSDGKSTAEAGNVALTGDAVSVNELKKEFGLISLYPFVWIFLIIALGAFILLLVARVSKKKLYSYPVVDSEIKTAPSKADKTTSLVNDGKTGVPVLDRYSGEAEHSLVLQGAKDESGIVALKIKNFSEVRKQLFGCEETLNKIIEVITKNRGSVYRAEDFIIPIFSVAITKTFSNQLTSVKVAQEIERILNEHNRKFKQKIDFGIGVNSGGLIVKKDNATGKLKFTAIGNAINLAKKIAEIANREVLLSDDANKKLIGQIKTDKLEKGGISVYKVRAINQQRESYAEFIQDFLKRQKEDRLREMARK